MLIAIFVLFYFFNATLGNQEFRTFSAFSFFTFFPNRINNGLVSTLFRFLFDSFLAG